MKKSKFKKWWKRLGFRRELRQLEKEKLAEQELLDTEEDNQAELSYMDIWNNSFYDDNFENIAE